MNRSILTLLLFTGGIIASLAFITAEEPLYKNLKVLKKNTSKKEMDSVMHFFAVSLGERCTFCHVRNEAANSVDFVSDANPHKSITRSMMRMTTKINKKYFRSEKDANSRAIQAVTCYTCHHGQGHPAVKALPAKANPATPPPPARPATDSAKAQQ